MGMMHHGRSHARLILLVAVVLMARGAMGQDAPTRKILPQTLTLAWQKPDHASGIYHVKADARLTVVVENGTDVPVDLAGEILFGTRGASGEFKTVSVTPISAASLAAGQRASVPLQVTFAAAGTYELQWKHG